jgi:ACT domain-containing protein
VRLEKNTVEMGVHKIVEQMRKIDFKNQMKIVTFEK